MGKKFSSTVAGGAIIITFFGLLGRVIGIIREASYANFFGLTQNYDLYLIGAVIPITINSIIIYLAQNFYIPNFNNLKSHSTEKAEKFKSSVFIGFTLIGLLIAIFLFSISDQIINLYIKNNKLEHVEIILKVLDIYIFTIPFSFSIAILSAILNADFEFKFPSYSQLYFNLTIIFVVFFYASSMGIFSIAWGYLIGTIVQFLYLYYKTNHTNPFKYGNLRFKEAVSFFSPSFFLIILIETLGQIYPLSDRLLYGNVDSGGLAALNYAFLIFLIPISVLSLSLSTAILPKLSTNLDNYSIEEKSKNIESFIGVNLLMIVPITFIIMFYGDIIIKILFERGQFTPGDSNQTFNAMRFYAISLIFYSSYAGINKLVYSSGLIKELFYVVLSASLIKLGLNFFLVRFMKQDGLALSSSISFLCLFFGTYLVILKNKLIISQLSFSKLLIMNLLNGIFSYLISKFLFIYIFRPGIIFQVLQIILFIIVFISLAKISRQPFLNVYFDVFKRVININSYSKRFSWK